MFSPRHVTYQKSEDLKYTAAEAWNPPCFKADSYIACRAHAVPLPCRAANGLECVFPIWFTQCGRVWSTLAMPCPCRAHAMLWPCRSSQGHDTARPSRDGLWATCPRSASSGYHAEFHEDCYQKHTNSPHKDPYLRLYRVVAEHYRKDDLLNCWASSSDISVYHADFHEGHDTIGTWQGRGMTCELTARHGMGTAWARHAMCESAFTVSYCKRWMYPRFDCTTTLFV